MSGWLTKADLRMITLCILLGNFLGLTVPWLMLIPYVDQL